MIHLALLLLCILAIEIFQRTQLLDIAKALIFTAKKTSKLISNKRVSDHWKELLVPYYALIIMRCSIKILMILVLIISTFLLADYFIQEFLAYTISFWGIIESFLFVYFYIMVKKYTK